MDTTELTRAYRDREAEARCWKSNGGQVVGYFADDVPAPLIEAAGLFPFRITGDPAAGQPAVMARGPIDVRADRLEMTNSWVHLFAGSHFDFVDRVIVSNSRKHILQLHERLSALPSPPEIQVLDRALGNSDLAREFNRRQVRKLIGVLEEWGGTAITRERLGAVVEEAATRATLLHRFAALRECSAPRISGTEALRVTGAARFLRLPQYNNELARLLRRAERAAPIRAPRIFLAGSPHEWDSYYAEIEKAGVVIVGEFHGWGPHLLERRYPRLDPLDAVADHYHENPDFVFPLARAVDDIRKRVARSGAQAVLFSVLEYDEATLWEVPSVRHALDIPCAYLPEQSYGRPDHDQIQATVRKLADGISS